MQLVHRKSNSLLLLLTTHLFQVVEVWAVDSNSAYYSCGWSVSFHIVESYWGATASGLNQIRILCMLYIFVQFIQGCYQLWFSQTGAWVSNSISLYFRLSWGYVNLKIRCLLRNIAYCIFKIRQTLHSTKCTFSYYLQINLSNEVLDLLVECWW